MQLADVFKCEATANSVTEHVCVNSNKKVTRKDGNRKEETQCTAYVYLIWMELF